MKIHLGLTLILVVSALADSGDPIVYTSLGFIEGYWKTSRSGRRFQAYEGIPYAQPPVGELRFEPPQPMRSWTGVLPAKFHPPECLQYTPDTVSAPSDVIGDEDCLYMHIYTNFNENNTKLLPVIIYLYGGAFQVGESIRWQPGNLMDHDLVYVAMNYRLGPLGFLSTGDGVVPGNMGIKDQVLAMKWALQNIVSFGGDRNQVTLAGLSSGAACVHLHFLSPMSRGLFHRAISGSGSALNPWAQNEASSEKSKKLGALMGCPTSDNRRMIQCIKTRPATTIYRFVKNFLAFLYNPFVPFGPVVENGSTDPFLDKPPIEIISSGGSANLPWIVSVDSEEGVYPAAEFLVNDKYTKDIDKNWEVYAPYVLDYNYTIPASQHANVSRYIRDHYLGNKHIGNSSLNEVIHMCGDRLFASYVGVAAMTQARFYDSPVWFHMYGYRGEYSMSDQYTGTNDNYGVGHGDEGFLIFDEPGKPLHKEQDIQMSSQLVKMWYSFVTTGIPNMGVEWTTVNGSSDKLDYLMISAPGQYSMKSDSDFMERKFWSTINFNENKLSLD